MVAEAAHGALMKLDHEIGRGTVKKIWSIHYVNVDVEATVAFIEAFSNPRSHKYGVIEGDRDFSGNKAASLILDPQKSSPHDMVVKSYSVSSSSGGKRQRRLKVAADSDSVAAADTPKKQKMSTADNDDSAADEDCVICMCPMTQPKKLACGHSFCADCIDESFKKCQPKCPNCGRLFGVMKGNQPPGTMTVQSISDSIPGFERCGSLLIMYDIPNGTQNVSLALKL